MATILTAIRRLLRQRPVVGFFMLVFAISWGGMLLITGPDGLSESAAEVEALLPAALLILFAGPSVAGLAMTGIVDGQAGYRELRGRLVKWRVAVQWYALAVLFSPLLMLGILMTLSLVSPAFLPGILQESNKAMLIFFGIAWGLIGGGLLEELGWTGFAGPKLRRGHSTLATGLIVGVIWGIWHVPIAFWTSGMLNAEESLAIYIAGFLAFYSVALPAFRVMLVWAHDRTHSLPVVMLMHASLSASTLILQPVGIGMPYLIWNLTIGAALWMLVTGGLIAAHRAATPRNQADIKQHV